MSVNDRRTPNWRDALKLEPYSTASPLYSQGVIAGSHLYVSGMVGVDPATGHLAGTDIVSQTRRALENCMAILAAGGASIEDIVEVGILLADPADFAGLNQEWARWFAQDQPARYVAKLGVDSPTSSSRSE